MHKGNVSLALSIEDLAYNGLDSDTLADALERDIESSGTAFRHVPSFVQTARTQNITGGLWCTRLTS